VEKRILFNNINKFFRVFYIFLAQFGTNFVILYVHRVLVGSLRERDHWGDPDVDGRIILTTYRSRPHKPSSPKELFLLELIVRP
jgi:hypothetical protein